jgi:hypothetical protein
MNYSHQVLYKRGVFDCRFSPTSGIDTRCEVVPPALRVGALRIVVAWRRRNRNAPAKRLALPQRYRPFQERYPESYINSRVTVVQPLPKREGCVLTTSLQSRRLAPPLPERGPGGEAHTSPTRYPAPKTTLGTLPEP